VSGGRAVIANSGRAHRSVSALSPDRAQFFAPFCVHEIVTAICDRNVEHKMNVAYIGLSLAHEGRFREAIP
jgi:hypothetical protein